MILSNPGESLFPDLHLLFILNTSDLNGIPHQLKDGGNYSLVGSDQEIIFMEVGKSKIAA